MRGTYRAIDLAIKRCKDLTQVEKAALDIWCSMPIMYISHLPTVEGVGPAFCVGLPI